MLERKTNRPPSRSASGTRTPVHTLDSGKVHIENHIPLIFAHVAHHLVAGDASVVDNAIVARFARFFEQCFRSRWAGNIERQALAADFLHQALKVCGTLRTVDTEDFSAVGGQDFCGCPTDTTHAPVTT